MRWRLRATASLRSRSPVDSSPALKSRQLWGECDVGRRSKVLNKCRLLERPLQRRERMLG